MFGNAKKSDSSTVVESSKKGTAYDLCRKVTKDGVEKLVRCGTVFIRSSGTGGAAWIVGDDGKKYELAIFARSGRKPKQDAATQPAAEAPAAA